MMTMLHLLKNLLKYYIIVILSINSVDELKILCLSLHYNSRTVESNYLDSDISAANVTYTDIIFVRYNV